MPGVRAEWLGHAAVRVDTAEGPVVLFDPYESGGFDGRVGYAPITMVPDIVAVTHYHADHAHLSAAMREAEVVDRSGQHQGLTFQAVPAYHDSEQGLRMGLVRMLQLRSGGHGIVHLGDLGAVPPAESCRRLAPTDLLLLPVGGNFTLDARAAAEMVTALAARLVVPIHYRNPCCTLPMTGVEPFVACAERAAWPVEQRHGSVVHLPDDLPPKGAPPRVVLLTPSHPGSASA